MGTIHKIDGTGDTKLTWSSRNQPEADAAKKLFDDLKGKGYFAFRVAGEHGDKGDQLTVFDKYAEKIIMIPPMSGGV